MNAQRDESADQGPDELPPEIDAVAIKNAIQRAENKNSDKSILFTTESLQLFLVTTLIALFLHIKLFGGRKSSERDHANVLGTATNNEINGEDDRIMSDAQHSTNRNENETIDVVKTTVLSDNKRKSRSNTAKTAAKEAASSRNYNKLLANRDVANGVYLSESTDGDHSNASLSKQETDSGDAAPYLNFDNFMLGKLEECSSSRFNKEDNVQSNDNTDAPINTFDSINNETAPIKLHTKAQHPGLEAYYHWKSTIMSLYRVYAIPLHSYPRVTGNDRIQNAALPMHPSSERGQTAIYIEVTNMTSHNVAVYWVNYRGNEVYKGSMRSGTTWNQTTYIGHPWTFRIETSDGVNEDDERSVLLKYVPFRVVPSIQGAETIHQENARGQSVGMQAFTLKDVPDGAGLKVGGEKWKPACVVEDFILPEPPLVSLHNEGSRSGESYDKLMSEIYKELSWSYQQMQREEAASSGLGVSAAKILMKYLSNVSMYPHEPKFRKLRVCNSIFMHNVYNTGARGVLLALGFEEHCGYLECGAARGQMLTDDRTSMISDAVAMLFIVLKTFENQQTNGRTQPMGADGFGRAGYGYAGSMNL